MFEHSYLGCDMWESIVLPDSARPATLPPVRPGGGGQVTFPIPPLAPREGRTISLAFDTMTEITCRSNVAIEVTTPDIDAAPEDNMIGHGERDRMGMPPPETRRDELPQTDAEAWGDPGF
ncbi:MAG: hypothetical protein ACYC9Y_15120 [Candidatus Methylomirabilia bacterium]